MTRRRGHAAAARTLLAAAAALLLGAGLAPLTVAVAAAPGAEPETVVPAEPRWQPPQETLITAGADGYLARNEAGTTRWVREADGSEGPGVSASGVNFNQGVHARQTAASPAAVELTDYASGAVGTVTAPAGQTWFGAFTGDAILTRASGTAPFALHVVRAAADGGAASDTPVTGVPEGAAPYGVMATNGSLSVVQLTVDGVRRSYLLDLGDASLREIFAGLPANDQARVVIGGTRVVATAVGGTTAYSVRIDDPSDTVEQTPFPAAVTGDSARPTPVPVGDRLLFVRAQPSAASAGLPLLSVPVGGGDTRTVLAASYWSYALAPDGSVLVVGGIGPADWGVRRITAAPGEDPVVSSSVLLPLVPARVQTLSYSGGRLAYSSTATSNNSLRRRDVTSGANPVVAAPASLWSYPPPLENCPTSTGTASCRHIQGLGTGTVAFLNQGAIWSPISTSGFQEAELGTTAPSTITDGSLGYVIANTPSTGVQTIADMEQSYDGNIVFTRPITASAVWGPTLWVPGTAAGTVRAYDLRTRTFGATVQTGAGCGVAFKELQADGRWLYWSCGTTAGVHDVTTGRNIAVPAGVTGDALLGDGFLVRHDAAAGQLVLTDVHTGAAATRVLADLPVTVTADRGVLWSVDKYGGGVAYVDAGQRVHVLPLADIPRAPLGLTTSEVDGYADLSPAFTPDDPQWRGSWTFSRPPASWALTVRTPTGGVAVSLGAASTAAAPLGTRIDASWDLRQPSGTFVPNGTYPWTLTVPPGDGGGGPAYIATGTIQVTGWAQGHDYTGDGTADLLGITAAGSLDTRFGTAAGGLTPGRQGAGWPASDTFVSFGDLDGDRYNDLLVRDATGKLWFYPGDAGAAFTPGMPHSAIGTGYQQYDLLAHGGDMNGDGIPDLLARDASGSLWLHAGDGAGGLRARTLVGTGYQQYTLIAGAGELSDASGSLPGAQIVARDASGVLWRHDTDGKGHFRARVRLGSGFGQYDSLTAVEMLRPGSGASLLARDTNGGLWRLDDNGNGGLDAARTWEGGGWQMYERLF